MRMLGHAFDITALDEGASARRHFVARFANRDRLITPVGWREGAEHVITGQRQEGKSHLALRWLIDAPEGVERVLIVETEHLARVRRDDLGLRANDPRIISWKRLGEHHRAHPRHDADRVVEYGVDGALRILTELLGLAQLPHLVTIATEPRDLS